MATEAISIKGMMPFMGLQALGMAVYMFPQIALWLRYLGKKHCGAFPWLDRDLGTR